MTAERWQQIQTQGGSIDLSRRAKWLITGEDRIRYLNGQVTQDVRKAKATSAVYACVTDVKGRLNGDIFIRVTEDGSGLLVDAEEGLREPLGLRLERYVVADDVEITDVTEAWTLVHYFGAAATQEGCAAERLGVLGCDVWVENGGGTRPAGMDLTTDEVEVLRILKGVARYPHELNSEVFPPEAGLELRAMDYSKGCYIGQEVLSRIRTTRKMPRELVSWALLGDAPVTSGASLSVLAEGAGEGRRVVGQVTSGVIHPETGRAVGLGYVKLGSVPDDSQLLVGNDLATIKRLVPGLSV
jgi:folate-binding protein YgfZ